MRDVKIVVDLDKKLDFINLARGVAHLGHISYEDVFYSSRFIEGAMLVYLRKLNVVAPNKTSYSGYFSLYTSTHMGWKGFEIKSSRDFDDEQNLKLLVVMFKKYPRGS